MPPQTPSATELPVLYTNDIAALFAEYGVGDLVGGRREPG